jgi:hypothetical protein
MRNWISLGAVGREHGRCRHSDGRDDRFTVEDTGHHAIERGGFPSGVEIPRCRDADARPAAAILGIAVRGGHHLLAVTVSGNYPAKLESRLFRLGIPA